MMKRGWHVQLVALLSVVVLAGCPGDRGEPELEPIPPQGMSPVEQMQETLTQLVQAQERHFQAHGSYTEDPRLLMQEFEFRPVGQTAVAIGFAGVEPQWEYLATATHPEAPSSCEVNAGRRVADQQPYMGSIDCTGA